MIDRFLCMRVYSGKKLPIRFFNNRLHWIAYLLHIDATLVFPVQQESFRYSVCTFVQRDTRKPGLNM